MSTYTDLHNRVQESINVDYSSRITPQIVKLRNEENEYWGTFKGALDVTDITASSGSLSNVTIKDAVLDGVTLRNASGLTDAISLDGYATEDTVGELCGTVQTVQLEQAQATAKADQAIIKATEAERRITSVVEDVTRQITNSINAVDLSVGSIQRSVDSALNNLDGKLDILSGALKTEFTVADSNIRTLVYNKVDLSAVNNAIAAEREERRDNDTTISNSIPTQIADERAIRVAAETQIRTDLGNEITTKVGTLNGRITDEVGTLNGRITSVHDTLHGEIDDEQTSRVAADTALNTAIGNETTQRDIDDRFLCAAITTETSERSSYDLFLSGAISTEAGLRDAYDLFLSSNISTEVLDRQSEDYRISNILSAAISDEIDTRIAEDVAINNTIGLCVEHINFAIAGEKYDRIFEDNKIYDTISGVVSDYISADKQLSDAAEQGLTDLSNALNDTEQRLLTAIAHDRHYTLNADSTTVDTWPLLAKDMAVNVFDLTLADGQVMYDDHGTPIEVAQLNVISDDRPTYFGFEVKTYAGIKSDSIVSSIHENTTYNLNSRSTSVPTHKGYSLQYSDLQPNALLSDLSIRLKAETSSYHAIYYNSTQVGKVYETVYDENNNIISGKYMLQSTSDSDLAVFNKFNGVTFNAEDLSSVKDGTERVTFSTTPSPNFKLERGIDSTKYISLIDKGAASEEFGRIYERIGVENGVDIDDGVVTKIRVASTSPLSGTVYLRRSDSNNFLGIVKTNVADPVTEKVYNYYLSATVDDSAPYASFKAFKAARLFTYPFVFTALDVAGENDTTLTSHVTPILYNKKITAATPDELPWEVKVDLSQVPVWNDFKHDNYILTRAMGESVWTFNEANEDGSYINIKYNITQLLIDYATPGKREVMYHTYNVLTEPDNDDGFNGNDVTVLFETNDLDLTDYQHTEGIPTATYTAQVDPLATEAPRNTYDMYVDTSETDVVKILIPSKIDYDEPISREMLVTIRIRTLTDRRVRVIFINEDTGREIKFYNNKTTELYLDTNKWTTLQLNEIKPDKFLLTDLNQNDDRDNFAKLFAMSAEHDTHLEQLDQKTEDNKNRIDSLTSMLSDAVRLKGDVLLKTDYNADDAREYDEHMHLSMLVGTCAGIGEDTPLERGFMFRCAVEDATKLSNTFIFSEQTGGQELSLDNNDYIILKNDCVLSDVEVGKVEVVKDFQNYIDRLSAASDEKYFINAGNNTVTGENTFANTTNVSTLYVDSLSANKLTAVNQCISALSVAGQLVVDEDGVNAITLSATSFDVADNLHASENVVSAKGFEATDDGVSAVGLSAPKLHIAAGTYNILDGTYADDTGLTAKTLSATTISAADLIIVDGKLTADNDGLTADGILSTTADLVAANNLSVTSVMLSANGIYADENGLSTNNLYAGTISVDSWNDICAIVDGNVASMNDELTAIKSNVSIISGIVDDALSSNCNLPQHDMTNQTPYKAVVSKLLLVDEQTYDIYALTMRNGTLNVDKVGSWPTDHPHPHHQATV